MNRLKKVNYTDEPIWKINVVPDFLPNPRELVLKEETEKVTLLLTKESLDFFKKVAKTGPDTQRIKYRLNFTSLFFILLLSIIIHVLCFGNSVVRWISFWN